MGGSLKHGSRERLFENKWISRLQAGSYLGLANKILQSEDRFPKGGVAPLLLVRTLKRCKGRH